MGDEDEGRARGAKACHLREEHFRLAGVEGGRRLVQEEDVAAPSEGGGDLDELQMAKAERTDPPIGIELAEGDAFQHGARLFPKAFAMDDSGPRGQTVQEEGLGHGQGGDGGDLLVHDRDPKALRLA
jgi:hypothetical protein